MENNIDMTPQQPNKQAGKPSKQPSKQPSTIEELQQWYADRHLPPEEVTRFFIGKDVREPKAFGIYKDENGNFVVYKNKASGERAIRYQGADEPFAVSELLSKLKEEIIRRKGGKPDAVSPTAAKLHNNSPSFTIEDYARQSKKNAAARQPLSSKKNRKGCFIVGIIMSVLAMFGIYMANDVPNGYYQYQDKYYYHLGSSWFLYDVLTCEWAPTESMDEWITGDNVDVYQISNFDGSPFEETGWYEEYYSSDDSGSSSDDDYDWDDDGGGWDSDDTDWDDDW